MPYPKSLVSRTELRSCVKVEVAILNIVSVDVEQHIELESEPVWPSGKALGW